MLYFPDLTQFVHLRILTDAEDKRKNAAARIKVNKFGQQTECNLLKATFAFVAK